MSDDNILQDYNDQILTELSKFGDNCHLLLGNGFNMRLGVPTSYEDVYARMVTMHQEYGNDELKNIAKNLGFDIEKFILEMQDKYGNSPLLDRAIENQIKIDFMEATCRIVEEHIHMVYDNNEKFIFLFFEKFANYFSLNFDPLLYLLLMRYGVKNDSNDLLAFQENAYLFSPEEVYGDIDELSIKVENYYRKGFLVSHDDEADNTPIINLKDFNATHFRYTASKHFVDKGWSKQAVEIACDRVLRKGSGSPLQKNKDDGGSHLEDKSDGALLLKSKNDGFGSGHLFNEYNKQQNIFYIHGAFHIYRDGDLFKKLTQKKGIKLYKMLADSVKSDSKNLTCVLRATTNKKLSDINESSYLQKCLDKLKSLEGCLVILGCSMSDNDEHIFKAIEESPISTVYIATSENSLGEIKKQAEKFFIQTKFSFFHRDTIKIRDNE